MGERRKVNEIKAAALQKTWDIGIVNQSMSQSIKQSINQLINRSINESINQLLLLPAVAGESLPLESSALKVGFTVP